MERTLFAGLTQLAPTEPLSTDDYSFQSTNPGIIDRLLEVGAVTHHHDGHAALADPSTAPDAALVIGGGQIPSDQTIEFAYTLIDAYRGETKASPVRALTTRPKISPPIFGPVAVADYTAGSLPPDTYYYGLTYVDGAGGETTLGSITPVQVEAGHANAQVLLSGLTSGMALASGAGWKLYKAVGGSDFAFCASGSSDSYIDAAACVDGFQPPPDLNSTQSYASIQVTLPALPAGATGYKLYGTTQSGTWDTFSYLASGGVFGDVVTLTTFSPTYGKPPERSLALPGAAKINPETDIANWHWRTPVSNFTDLPAGSLGDVKLVTATGEIYAVLTASTSTASGWTNVGPSGTVKYVSASGGTRVASPSELIFEGASGAAVIVERVGGSAKVTIVAGGGGGGTADGSDIHIAGSAGSPTLLNRDYVEYGASGSASVAIQDLGGGSARILIGTRPYPRQGIDVGGSAGVPTIYRRDYVEFVGSAGGIVGVQDMGLGSARVVISASAAQGPAGAQGAAGSQGPAGDGTITRVSGSAISAAIVTPVRHLEFGGSGRVDGCTVQDLGGGSARVIASGGVVPACRLSKSAAQAIPNNTATLVTFDGTQYDEGAAASQFDNAQDGLVCRRPGRYQINWCLQYAGVAAGSFRGGQLQLNGTTTADSFMRGAVGTNANVMTAQRSQSSRLSEGDLITILALHDRGSNLDVQGVTATFIEMVWLGP